MKGNKANFCKELIFFFICLYYANASNALCHIKQNCNYCDYCGKETNNYESCSYYNIFCYNSYVWTSESSYSQFYKKEYIEYFDKDNEIKSFCGTAEFLLDNKTLNKTDLTIFDSQEKIFPKNKTMHCHYSITTIGEANHNPKLEFKMLRNENVNEDRHLQFQISNIIKYNSEKEELESYSQSQIQRRSATFDLTRSTKFEIFIDFLESGYNQPEEIFQIKVSFSHHKEESSKSIGSTIGGVVGGIGGLIVIVGVVAYCCRKKEVYVVEKESNCQIF